MPCHEQIPLQTQLVECSALRYCNIARLDKAQPPHSLTAIRAAMQDEASTTIRPANHHISRLPAQPANVYISLDGNDCDSGHLFHDAIVLDSLSRSGYRRPETILDSQPAHPTFKRALNDLRSRLSARIAPNVPIEACRDFYALERTFLAYVRTASAYAGFGVTVAQLFRLQGSVMSTQTSAIFHLGRPIGAAAIAGALLLILWAGFNFWKQQQKLLQCHFKSPNRTVWCIVVGTLAVRQPPLSCA